MQYSGPFLVSAAMLHVSWRGIVSRANMAAPPLLRPTPLQRVLSQLNSRDCFFPVSPFCEMGFCDDHFAYIVVADILLYCC